MYGLDKKPELIVVYGGDIPHHVLEEVATKSLLLNNDVLIPTANLMKDGMVYDVTDMHIPHIVSVVECLQDHIDNTKPEEWLEHQSDYALNSGDLYHPEEDELWVNISMGTYFGQNCKVTVYNITI